MNSRQQTIDLNDIVKINSDRIESWVSCCSGTQLQPMDGGSLEMGSQSYKELFIFGSWRRRSRRRRRISERSIPVMTLTMTNPLSVNKSESTSNGNTSTKEKKLQYEAYLLNSQRSSTYRPASYESSFCETDESRSAIESLVNQRSQSEQKVFDEDYLLCPRCGDKMTEPRLLDCLHSICALCIHDLLDQGARGKFFSKQPPESSRREESSQNFRDGCPVCGYPLPQPGSPLPPPHYPLQHRLVMEAVRRRLSHRILCCDVCPEEVQASVHCSNCLRNFCSNCGTEHEERQNRGGIGNHRVQPLWEAKRFRRTTLCPEHPSHALRFHCIACQQVTCRECMWRGSHRGHASEGASGAGRRATSILAAALQRARKLLNALLIEYNERSFATDNSVSRPSSALYSSDMRYSDEIPATATICRNALSLDSYVREAQERINEFARLEKARYLLDAISLGDELIAEGFDVEILNLSHIILKRLQMLGLSRTESGHCANETVNLMDYNVSELRSKHTGVYHCCTFCSSGGKKEVTCACRGSMPGGYRGCGHGHPGHPRAHHWSCCGSTIRNGSCPRSPKLRYQVVL